MMSHFNYTKWMQQNRVGPYGKNLNESEHGDAPFDFVKAAIESASGDKISHSEEDTYGEPIYWSATKPHVTYHIGSNDQIIKYDGETGERYPIGNLTDYDEPTHDYEPDTDADYEEPVDRNIPDDYNDGEFWESKKPRQLNEQTENTYTTDVTVDVIFDGAAVYNGKVLSDTSYYDVVTKKINYLIEIEARSWGIKGISVYGATGDKTISFEISVEEGDDEEEMIDFEGEIDWSKVEMESEGVDVTYINPTHMELRFDKDCKFVEGTIFY